MTDVVLRPARKSDAADLAILDNIAGHGISLWFWQGAVNDGKAEDAFDWGRSRFAADDVFGWKNATIAEIDDDVAGSITSYVMPPLDEEENDIKKNAKPFVPVFELFAEAVGHWFIDSLAVYQSARGTGIGKKLLDHSLALGRKTGLEKASLVCEDSNHNAINLYASRGFGESAKRPYLSFGTPSRTRDWLLMELDFRKE